MEKFEGKTLDIAMNNAIQKFGVASEDELNIKILDEGSKGFLGLMSRNAVIEAEVIFNPEKVAKDFIRELAVKGGLALEVKTTLDGKNMDVEISGEDAHAFIGKRGITLDSLQYIVSLVVNKGDTSYVNVRIDIENYRARREETLKNLATNLSKKVYKTGKPYKLEPMSANERRIIHVTLQDNKMINTTSEGKEPFRYVVISKVQK